MSDWLKRAVDKARKGVVDETFEKDLQSLRDAAQTPVETPGRTIGGTAKDVGIAGLKGAIALPEAAVGIADLFTGGHAGKSLEQVGFRPAEAKQILEDQYSPAQKAAKREFSEAEGIVGKTKAAFTNPSIIVEAVGESLPLMLGGGAVARGLSAVPKLAGSVGARAAIGEGIVGGGAAAEGIRQQTEDGLLSPGQSALAAASGVGTAAFGYLGARIGKHLGLEDIDVLAAGGRGATKETQKGTVRRVLEGAAQEGLLEELPQSLQEQVFQNLALGKDITEGLDEAAVLGTLAGAVMGGGANVLGRQGQAQTQAPPQIGAVPQTTDLIPYPAGPLSRAVNKIETVTPEVLPRERQLALPSILDGAIEEAEIIPEAALPPGTGQINMGGAFPLGAPNAYDPAGSREDVQAPGGYLPPDPVSESISRKIESLATPQETATLPDGSEIPERRSDAETRKRVLDMTPEEMARTLLTSSVANLPNKRAYEEAEKKPAQAFVDADSLKWINDELGHEAGDDLLRAIGEAFAEEGAEAYHVSGDEFLAQGESEEALTETLSRVQKRLDEAIIEATLPDGSIITKKGLGISYGLGKDLQEAESRLQPHKQLREKEGARAARGEEPPGVFRKTPQGQQDQGEASEEVETYAERLKRRTARVAGASAEDLDTILAEEHADSERHFDGTSTLTGQVEMRRLQMQQEEAAAQAQARYDAGEWVLFEGTAPGASQLAAQARAEKLSAEDPANEYRAIDGSVERRKVPTSAPQDKPALILTTKGAPFANKGAASLALKARRLAETHEVVETEGGFALSPKGRESIDQETGQDVAEGQKFDDFAKNYERMQQEIDEVHPSIRRSLKRENFRDPLQITIETVGMQSAEPGEIISIPYDGTEAEARRLGALLRLFAAEDLNASMRGSRMAATDKDGRPAFVYSQGAGEMIMEAVAPPTDVTPEEDRGLDREPQAAEEPKQESAPEKPQATVSFNADKGGIEIAFPAAPDEDLKRRIKGMGFRWSKRQKLWYAKDSPVRRQFVERTFGQKAEPPKPSEYVDAAEDLARTFAKEGKTRQDFMEEAGATLGWNWTNGQGITNQTAAPIREAFEKAGYERPGNFAEIWEKVNGKKEQPESLGENRNGNPVFEDENGNRYYVENGVRVSAPRTVTPTRAGVETAGEATELLYKKGRLDFLTAEEVTRFQAEEAPAEGMTLLEAQNLLIELRTQAESQGRVTDARLLDKISQVEKLVRDLEAEAASPKTDTDPKPAKKASVSTLPSGYGADNKLVTRDRAEELAAKLRAKASTLTAGVDPELLMVGAELAVYHIEAGARSFVKFTREMANHLGQETATKLAPYFKAWYSAAKNWPGIDKTGMDSEATVDALDIADILDIKEESANDPAREEGPAVRPLGESELSADEEPGGDAQQGAAPADSGDLEAGAAQDDGRTAGAGASGETGVRAAGADVPQRGGTARGGDAADGRPGDGGEGVADAGARGGRGGRTPFRSNYHIDDPKAIAGGGQVARFEKNKAAIELYHTLEEEGREPTWEEKGTLAGYTGWGSFGQELFNGSWENPQPKKGWEARDGWLRDHLGETDWKSAQRSILNAHYTDPPTVQTMWSMLEAMGFAGGKVLEPAMGIGNFFGLMPESLARRSSLTGIELDSLTGGMAKLLYPQANISIKPFQDSKTPDDFYDAVIGNWPFDSLRPADRKYRKLNPVLHDYFYLKALDQVRPGGIVMGITSHGTMDKVDKSARRAMAQKAELVAAFRLPTGAFQEYAGTAVVTDIIILRKREQPVGIVEDSWIHSEEVDTPSGEKVRLNRYYSENPQNVLGTVDYGHGTTSMRPGLIVHRPADLMERLQSLVSQVPADGFREDPRRKEISYITNHTDDRQGALTLTGDGLFVVQGEHLAPAREILDYHVKSKADTAARKNQLEALISLRKAYAALVDAERKGQEKGERKALKKIYDDFVKEHGALTKSYGLSYLRRIGDPFWASLAALEVNRGTAKKADWKPARILSESTMRAPLEFANPGPQEAFILARNRSVSPTLAEVAQAAGQDPEKVRQELVDSGAVFETLDRDIVPADIYLSGNVRAKLREAEAAVKDGAKHLERNVEALKEVIPEDIPYHKIEVQLGATWVPETSYADYVAHMLDLPEATEIKAEFIGGTWKVRFPSAYNHRPQAQTGFGTPEVSFKRLVNAAVSNQSITVKYKDRDGAEHVDTEATEKAAEAIAKIREEFQDWLWSDAGRRVALEREYNEARNAFATPRFDGSFLKFQGMSLQLGENPFDLRQHQRDAIWRALVTRRSLDAHEVGTGKTFTMGGIAVESRRYGIARKPLMLAHNANSATVAAEIQTMYPAAKILYIDNLSPATIDVKLRQIANDDWDLIVMPHSLIDRLALTEETLMAMAQEEIDLLEQEAREAADEDGVAWDDAMLDDPEELKKLRSPTAKDLVRTRNTILENIRKSAQRASRENAVPFEELGVDMLLVDEAHEFKKPPISTKMRMKGLNTSTSSRSVSLRFLSRYVRAQNGGGNIHLFTGTPITNTLTEVFHHMLYIMEDEMKAEGLDTWDGWFGSFASEVQDVELNAAAEYENVTRLAAFINVPELRRMFGQYMDVVFSEDMPEMVPRKTKGGKTLDDPTLTESERNFLTNGRTEGAKDRPYKKVIVDNADMTAPQQEAFQRIQGYARSWRAMTGKDRMAAMRNGDPESPIIYEGLATKASLDVRLMTGERYAGQEGKVEDHPDSKASRAVKNILEIYKSHKQTTQAVFTEIGLGKSVSRTEKTGDGGRRSYTVKVLSTVHDMVERLVAGGIPREQIAVVTGSTTKQKRKEIAEKMNRNEIRVVFGNTSTLGVGVNMQKNLRAMHHLDAPWMPGDLEQRNGRGHRQGNQWNTVLEYRYITDRLDGRRWQVLAIKSRFIKEFLTANGDTRVIEGDAAADDQNDILETFSNAAGDPRILLLEKAKKKVEKLQRRERSHTFAVADAAERLRDTERRLKHGEEEAELRAKAVELIDEALQKEFSANVQGTVFEGKEATRGFIGALDEFIRKNVRIGDRNVPVGSVHGFPVTADHGHLAEEASLYIDVSGYSVRAKPALVSINRNLRNVAKNHRKIQESMDEARSSLERLREISQEPFSRKEELETAKRQVTEIEEDMEKNPVPPPAWLRNGAPVETVVRWHGDTFEVTGHRWTEDGWFVMAQDVKGQVAIPYNEVTDEQGMALYDERDFEPPEVVESKPADQNQAQASRSSRSKGTPLEDLKKILDPIVAELGGAAPVKIFSNQKELPGHIRDFIASSSGEGAIEGVFDPKTKSLYLLADQIESAERGRFVLFHELGHFGFDALGEEGKDLLNRIYLSKVKDAQKIGKQYGFDLTTAKGRRQAAGEVIANEFAKREGQDPKLIERVIAAVRKWMRRVGIDLKLSDSEISVLVGRMAKALREPAAQPHSFAMDGGYQPWRGRPEFEGQFERGEIGPAGKNLMAGLDKAPTFGQLAILEDLHEGFTVKEDRGSTVLDSDTFTLSIGNTEEGNYKTMYPETFGYEGGQGIGTRAYILGTMIAKDQDMGVVSDNIMSASVRRTYERMIELGIPFKGGTRGPYTISPEALAEVDLYAVAKKFFQRGAPDIRFSRAAVNTADPAEIKEAVKEGIDKAKAWQSERLDYLRMKFQDKFLPLKRLQQKLEKRGWQKSEEADAYLTEELSHGKIEDALEKFQESHVAPLLEALKGSSVTFEEMEEYLYARHAAERNAYIQEINPEFEEGGSGMTDEEAEAVMARLSSKRGELEKLAKKVDAITARQRQIIREAGLETDETVAAWERFEHYVPLKGKPADMEDGFGRSIGRGANVRGSGTKNALGRKSKAENILANLIAQTSDSIIRAEKAQIGRAFLQMAEENPDPSLWTVHTKSDGNWPTRRALVGGEVRELPDHLWHMAPNILAVTRDGQIHYVEIKDPDLARVMGNLNPAASSKTVQVMGWFTRKLAQVNTSLNPEFIVTNFERDLQTAMVNLAGEKSGKAAKDVLKGVPGAMRGIRNALRGDGKHEMAAWYERFKAAGGKVGFMDLAGVDAIQKEIEREVATAQKHPATQKVGRYFQNIGRLVNNYNTVVENAVRLSAFRQAIESGATESQAASLAKNLTVNFNRKGELGPAMNAAYMFFNAGVQGSSRLVSALTHKRTRKIALGIVGTGILMAELSRLAGGDDDDGESRWDKLDDFTKETNFLLMREDGSLMKVKLPYGYNVFVALGYALDDAARYVLSGGKEGKRPAKAMAFVSKAALSAFNPLGGEGSWLQTVSPTITDPFVQITENKNFFGAPVMPEQNPWGPPKPDSQRYFSSVRPLTRAMAEKLNRFTGGTEFEPGVVDVSPETLDHFWDFVLGGLGRFIADTPNIARKAAGQEVPLRRVPFARQVMAEPNTWADSQRFYDNLDTIERGHRTMQAMREGGDARGAFGYLGEHPEIRLRRAARAVQKQASALSARRRALEEGPERKKVEERLRELYTSFNKRMREL